MAWTISSQRNAFPQEPQRSEIQFGFTVFFFRVHVFVTSRLVHKNKPDLVPQTAEINLLNLMFPPDRQKTDCGWNGLMGALQDAPFY